MSGNHPIQLTEEQKENYRKLKEANQVYQQGLYDYLRTQCPTLEAAKTWITHWANELEQYAPDIPGVTDVYLQACNNLLPANTPKDSKVMFSISMMSIIVACAVENRGAPGSGMMRADTEHGWELFYVARGDRR